jgi:hypothetical protein
VQCLQLVDDLQDTLKDTEVNHQTLFTYGWTRKQSGTAPANVDHHLLALLTKLMCMCATRTRMQLM